MEDNKSVEAFAQRPPSKQLTSKVIHIHGFVDNTKLKALLQDRVRGARDCIVNVSRGIPADCQDLDKWERGEQVALLGEVEGEAPRKAEWILRILQCLCYKLRDKMRKLPPGSIVLTNYNELYPEMECAYALYHREMSMDEITEVSRWEVNNRNYYRFEKNLEFVHVHVNHSPEKCQELFKATEEKKRSKMDEEKFEYYKSSMEIFLKNTPKAVIVEGEEGVIEYIKSL